MRRSALMLLVLASCSAPPAPTPVAGPPPAAQAGITDPARGTVLVAADEFAHPDRLRANPAAAARALARLEWLAAAAPQQPGWQAMNPLVMTDLGLARDEARVSLGLPANMAPAQVITALEGAAAALADGDRARAASVLGERPLARLSSLPPLRLAGPATTRLQRELNRLNQRDEDE